jgi:hypothetical protein
MDAVKQLSQCIAACSARNNFSAYAESESELVGAARSGVLTD